MQSIYDQLKSLGIPRGTSLSNAPNSSKPTKIPINQIIPGEWDFSSHGKVFTVTREYPANHKHGIVNLNHPINLTPIAAYIKDASIRNRSLEQIAFLDTETTGLMGGTGTYTFLVGIGRFIDKSFVLKQFFLHNPAEESAQLTAIKSFLSPTNTVVTYNGKSFDIPLLNTRYILNAISSPFKKVSHIDLLHLARRLWKQRVASCTLNNIEKEILNLQRSNHDIPGWMIPNLYTKYLQSGDATPLKDVFYHNEIDIVSLSALLIHVTQILELPLKLPQEQTADLLSIAKFFADIGDTKSAIQIYRHCITNTKLNGTSLLFAIKQLSFLEKKRKRFQNAISLWEIAAERGEVYACVELSKVYEHHYRQLKKAQKWAQIAIEITCSPGFSPYERTYLLPELEHRLKRILRKQGVQTHEQ